MSRFDPTDWIDAQREAGNARGNVFSDILAACEQKRASNLRDYDGRLDQRLERVRDIKSEAARFDALVDPEIRPLRIPTFSELVAAN